MIDLGSATADEMVLAFLQAEIDSPRFSSWPRHWLLTHRINRTTLIDNGLLCDPEQNRLRIEILKGYRGYQDDRMLFTGFPSNVQWRRVEITRAELADFRYANEPSLIEVSGESRIIGVGAERFKLGKAPADFSERVRGVAECVKNKARFPDLIAVAAENEPPVLVEGHTRATAYVYTKPSHPIIVLIGTSPTIKQWHYF